MSSLNSENIVAWYNQEQQKCSIRRKFERRFHVTPKYAQRLSIEKELKGHGGCVNCVEWNHTGELLASGSDDFNVIVWDMLNMRIKKTLPTKHEGNIFSVKFLPYSNDNSVASSSADASIRVQAIENGEQIHCFNCHIRRVKRLGVTRQLPFMLWSGSEDGTIREFDIREPHSCSMKSACRNVLIDLTDHIGHSSEVKCIQLHPLYPEYIAVGSRDPYLRLYDRRMLSVNLTTGESKSSKNSYKQNCVKYFTPGHLKPQPIKDKNQREKMYVTTHINFSPNGEEIIQNLGVDHIYVYDMKCGNSRVYSSECSNVHTKCRTGPKHKNGYSKDEGCTYAKRKLVKDGFFKDDTIKSQVEGELPKTADNYKLKGNDAFSKKNYFQAIVWYNKALKISPSSSVLYANKAAALLKRAWDGDIYHALRLCQKAIDIDPTHVKAMYRQIRCLYELKLFYRAKHCLDKFKEEHPEQADSSSFKSLECDLKKVLDEEYVSDVMNQFKSSTNGTRHRRRQSPTINDEEQHYRRDALDYTDRYVGACNINTDIKEANFFGNNGQFIIAGSDCGCMLLWDRQSTNLIEAWQADESIVNCLQPHPSTCMLATSGIDPVVRIWSPRIDNHLTFDPRSRQIEKLVRANQKRMNADPLEEMLRSMGYRAATLISTDDNNDDESSDQCRTQ